MVGEWAFPAKGERPLDACQSDETVSFSKRGFYVGTATGDYGRWRIEGNRLWQAEISGGGGSEGMKPEKPWFMQFRHVRDGLLEVRDKTGRSLMVRCNRSTSLMQRNLR
jgi:hypothetical protein